MVVWMVVIDVRLLYLAFCLAVLFPGFLPCGFPGFNEADLCQVVAAYVTTLWLYFYAEGSG